MPFADCETPLKFLLPRFFLMHFLRPLLIECGYPVNRDDLTEAGSESLAPAQYDYIQHALDRPRGLRQMCWDSLRNHVKGRSIRDFVNMLHVPESIKNYILLKEELLINVKWMTLI